MKALVLKENALLEYRDVPMPRKISSNSYLIRIVASGICGSDIHRGFENGAYHYPLIMGHEFSGIIEKPLPGGKYTKGQRVVTFPLLPCKGCKACQTGDYGQCSNYNYFGSRCDGGFAEYIYVPEENLIPIPDHVDTIHAAMTEPCAVALHGVRKLHIMGGETAVVYGGGPIGNMMAQWLRICGCNQIIIVDIDEKKLKIAKAMGFTTINTEDSEPVTNIFNITGGEGADKAVEACGLPITYRQSIQSVRKFGEIVFMGTIGEDLTIGQKDVSSILRKELTIYGAWNSKIVPRGKDDWSTVLNYMDKKLNIAPIISHTPVLKDGVEVFNRIVAKKELFNKVIFKVRGK